MFSSLFGSSSSDKADKLRQDAINAFNSIKTPDLQSLQVQLQQEVSAGKITPQQAEASLLNSNAFNSIATDPNNTAAQKQALTALQATASAGGLTAIDKAQLQAITNQQNQVAQGRNAAVTQNLQERGIGGSGLELTSKLANEQGAADIASQQGTDVAAQAQARALQAIQAAGSLGGSMEQQQYGEQANKAAAQNAIDTFNANTRNQFNLTNTQNANTAQAANIAAQQALNERNTATANANKEYNAQQNETVFGNNLAKAQGVAGVETGAANAAQAQKNMETGADIGLISKGLGAAGAVGGAMVGGPIGSAIGSQAGSSLAPQSEAELPGGGGYNPNAYTTENQFAKGGKVKSRLPGYFKGGKLPDENKALTETEADENPDDDTNKNPSTAGDNKNKAMTEDEAFSDFCRQLYSKGGKVSPFGDLKKGALHRDLGVASDKPIPEKKLSKALNSDNETLRKRAQFAENAKHWNHKSGGGMICEYNQGGKVCTYKEGGYVPGVPNVPGDSPANDTVKAKLSPGEIVVPRTVAKVPEAAGHFAKTISANPETNEKELMRRALGNLTTKRGY